MNNCPVLVVEDDRDLREMMVAMLALEGFEPQSASDGQDALEQLRSGRARPHVIVLDMMMPRMDGWQFCRRRDADPDLKAIPVVVLSAAPRATLDVGAEAVLPKPFDYGRLVETIRTYC